MSQKEPSGFAKAKRRAEELFKQKNKIEDVLKKGQSKAKEQSGKIYSAKNDLMTFIEMIKANLNGTYTNAPNRSIIFALAAVIYFINPFDLIPDFLVGIGLLDDIGVVSFVLKAIKKDLDKFKEWQFNQSIQEAEIVE